MIRTLGLAAAIGFGLTAAVQAQTVENWMDRIDSTAFESGGIELDLHHAGEVDGFMRFGWYAEGDEIVIWDRTMWASREIYESFEARIGGAELDPHDVHIRFHQGPNYYRFDYGFEPGRAEGRVEIVRPGQPESGQALESDLPDGTVLRASVFMLAAILPLEVGESIALDWFAPMTNSVTPITLSAVERVMIDTPSGPVETIRLEQRGGQPPNDIFVVPETREVVRIDIGGQDMTFLARPEETPPAD
ncbi:hypothetical protein [Maricaulis parjimensis]|uniref:hypothetical protein n=1 Tax=Maricaulis parjimensis TaxID=144023 RepID=UPI00193ADCBA|nr:hypothetical protein [Maricaulis parjimensis]